MARDAAGEKWKTLEFDFEYSNNNRIEISNYGRIKTYNAISNGNILNGTLINGYRIIRLKFFKPRDAKAQNKLTYLDKQVKKLSEQIKLMKETKKPKKEISEVTDLLNSIKTNLKEKYADDTKKRTIHYHSLVHRLVADHFIKQPSPEHTVVAHLDYDKLNNNATNLKWMTPEENYLHQRSSPYVIEEKKQRKERKEDSKASKLTIIKVMLLKKLLNQGKPIKALVKQFKVTDTQILRIKRGENWGDVKAAP